MVQSSTLLTKVVHHYLQLQYLHRNSSSTQQELQIARATRITHLTTRLSRFPLFTILASFVFILYQVVTNSFFLPFFNNKNQMVPIAQLPVGKKLAMAGQSGKLWRWKRSHHQWLLQFKWKWQKPWKLSELIRHSDETIMRARPRPHSFHKVV